MNSALSSPAHIRETAESLYLTYKDRIYGYIFCRVKNPQEAEDVLSEVFYKIVKSFDTYDPAKASVSTWIYTVTRNTVLNYFRKPRNAGGEFLEAEKLPDLSPLPDEIILREEEREALISALEQLPQRERDVIILRFYHEYTPVQVSQLTGISYANVKVIQTRAVQRLREIMYQAGFRRN